ncbi:hypothetical protein ML8HA_00984 [Lactococcus lactis]|nr:hypothetical protein [Lactococcus lactis]
MVIPLSVEKNARANQLLAEANQRLTEIIELQAIQQTFHQY